MGDRSVYVVVADHIPDAGALAAGDKEWISLHTSEGACRAVDATWYEAFGTFEKNLGVYVLFQHVNPYLSLASQRAASLAWYVMMMSAPARLIAVRTSRVTRWGSIHSI